MRIKTECVCGKRYATESKNIGRRFQCKQCGAALEVLDPDAEPAEDGADEEAWVAWIRDGRDTGLTRREIREEMEAQGVAHEEATALIDHALARRPAARSGSRRTHTRPRRDTGGGDGLGWLAWVGMLLLINFLSWAFDWPFWIY